MEYSYLFNKLEEVNKIPYPKVNVERKNVILANIILDNYSGSVSELSAVLKYVYQNINLKDTNLAKIIGKISIVEMHHLEILGKIIILGKYMINLPQIWQRYLQKIIFLTNT